MHVVDKTWTCRFTGTAGRKLAIPFHNHNWSAIPGATLHRPSGKTLTNSKLKTQVAAILVTCLFYDHLCSAYSKMTTNRLRDIQWPCCARDLFVIVSLHCLHHVLATHIEHLFQVCQLISPLVPTLHWIAAFEHRFSNSWINHHLHKQQVKCINFWTHNTPYA